MTVCEEWWQENACGSPCNDVCGQHCLSQRKKKLQLQCATLIWWHIIQARTLDRRKSVVYSNVLHLPIGVYNLRIWRFHWKLKTPEIVNQEIIPIPHPAKVWGVRGNGESGIFFWQGSRGLLCFYSASAIVGYMFWGAARVSFLSSSVELWANWLHRYFRDNLKIMYEHRDRIS